MPPVVAIVGRPNVGKSTLFNRLVGKRLALVDDRPGVTRDRRMGDARLGDLEFRVIDTAGFDEGAAQSLGARMQAQTEAAIREADAILFLMDARAGITPDDRAFAQIVRRSEKPVVVVANKAEGKAMAGAYEAFELGLGEPVAISAEHNEGLADLYESLAALLPEPDDGAAENGDRAIKVAVVGRPNAGKSTLINRLLGEDRLLTGPEPGITRDSISVEFRRGSQRFELHDTAGLRRKSRIEDKLEKLSAADALNAIRFAEVVILLLDSERPFEEQDLRIADLVVREGRALVIGMNKSDLADPAKVTPKKLREQADHWLPQAKGMPIVAVSGLQGQGLDKLLDAVEATFRVWNTRVPTAALNRFLEAAISQNPPPAISGGRIKLRYMTQPKARPPSFVLFGTRTSVLPDAYTRYLVNGMREAFDLPGVPIRLAFREADNPFAGKKRR
ncbi:MAG TPA: ribosome biogenesis GTPase Der [Xanthobacteraceae bacterium]|nr:ribosome biogenesis GTPase Der [Xanthobacteraceae bacterium]